VAEGPVPGADELHRRLTAHLVHSLGSWPPAAPFEVVGSPLRMVSGWDGEIRPLAGLETPAGTVVSVPPHLVEPSRRLLAEAGPEGFAERIGELVADRATALGRGVFRWCQRLTDLSDAGEWLDADDERLPDWLRPFNGPVLAAFDGHGEYAAGVGRKRHGPLCQELAVATELAHRGHGLARRLVAQAARRVVAEGAVATYLHRVDNRASAAVAEAAGFPDVGWFVLGLPTAS